MDKEMEIVIETERLLIREVIAEDEQGFYELDTDPDVHKYLGNNPSTSINQVRETIKFIQQQYTDNGIGRFTIIEKETKRFIGWAGLKFVTEQTNGHQNYYDLGYRLVQKHWGKGFATETAKATLEYAFDKLNLEEVYSMCDSDNIGSKNVLEKAGLTFVETFDLNGIEHNWFKITKSDWDRG